MPPRLWVWPQVDFRYEADLHEACASLVRTRRLELGGLITVPLLHPELCASRLLVMEAVDGCKLTRAKEHFGDAFDLARHGTALRDALETFAAMQIFGDGSFHGDPHPGNLMLRRRDASSCAHHARAPATQHPNAIATPRPTVPMPPLRPPVPPACPSFERARISLLTHFRCHHLHPHVSACPSSFVRVV